jgi:hypothetical protein
MSCRTVVYVAIAFVLPVSAIAQQPDSTVLRALATVCGDTRLEWPGAIFGVVEIAGDATPRADVEITARWAGSSRTTRTDAKGVFRFCGVPTAAEVTLSAKLEGTRGAPFPVRVPAGQPIVRAELSLDRVAVEATLTGVVMTDSTRVPIIGAEISLPAVGKMVLADERGAFRITGIPAGEHRVSIRRIGYGALDTRMLFAPGETVTRNVFLSRAVTLDSVRTTALRGASLEFEENRRLGLGKFLTREDMEKAGESTLGAVLATVSGLHVVQGRGAAWVVTSRNARKTGVPLRTGDAADRLRGAVNACYSNVYLDNLLIYSGRAEEPLFDVNSLRASDIENIEYYSGLLNMPVRYMTRNKDADLCGVIVIRTRR